MQVYVTENLLRGDYSSIINRLQSSGVAVTLKHFGFALELACIGPVHSVLAPFRVTRAVDSTTGDESR